MAHAVVISVGRSGSSRRWTRVGLAAVLGSLAGGLVSAPTALAACETGTVTFTNVDGEQCYTVPSGVTSLAAAAVGAPGTFYALGPEGGYGGVVLGQLSVTSGETLYVEVGSPGGLSCSVFGGGGAGGGGGSSDVRTESISSGSGSVSSRLLVAAGGAGVGWPGGSSYSFLGGAGGNPAVAGGDGEGEGGAGGGGATSNAGGAGGSATGDSDGSAGSLDQGGAGGSGADLGGGGGGGGGGYYGGGGGGGGATDTGGGGGGGGSDFAAPSVSNVSVGVDSTGTPEVEIFPNCKTGDATFTYTGGEQCYAALAGASSVNVQVVGGAGATNFAETSGGGRGAVATGTIAVTDGEELYVEVGGNGSNNTGGGFNGGGEGGYSAGSGGGETDLRTVPRAQSNSWNSLLLLAGGGGGEGSSGFNNASGGDGGASTSVGEAGGNGANSGGTGGGGGAGGTSSAGGAGGAAGSGGTAGDAGGQQTGGAGGGANDIALDGGGGGGGGYFGGGGGGSVYAEDPGGGGGGGGSSFAASSVESPAFVANTGKLPPEVVIEGFTASPAAIERSLLSQLAVAGRGARIGAILAARRYSAWLRAIYPGRLAVRWSSRVSTDGRLRNVLIGTARANYRTPSFRRVNVILTPAGRKRLRAVDRLVVTIRATFAPRGHRSITISRTIVLHRRPPPIHDRAAPGPRHDEVHANTGVVPYWSWAWSHQG
jgi:hypothetical protein